VGERPRPRRRTTRRRRLLTRGAPVVVLAVAAFILGLIVAGGPGRAEHKLVRDYVTAWASGDFHKMYGLLDKQSQASLSESAFVAAYRNAATIATLDRIRIGHIASRSGDAIAVRVRVRTRVFGNLSEVLQVPLAGSGSSARVRYSGTLLFPGLRHGETLTRNVALAPRADILASDGTPLAHGPARSSPISDVASQIVGTLGPIPAPSAQMYAAQGYPPDAKVGEDGLERIFQSRVAGTPGGTLLAGTRALAHSEPIPGKSVTTTINPAVERAEIAAIAGRSAGMAAMDPRTGAVLGLAGFAFSELQPPGSTMKIITATAALDAGLVKLTDTFPEQSAAYVGGFLLHNANGEVCGGTFYNAFAVSCNSVFAPLGVKIGAKRLVAMAEKFGFNQPTSILGAAESTIPSAATIGNDTNVGSAAIGQDKVLATSLEMADVGATIAMGGKRPIPTLVAHQRPSFVHVTSRRVARLVQKMMIAVVSFGTGTSASIPGVTIAGKTGTAEIGDTNGPNGNTPQNTDAWFVGYGPVPSPRIVVGALFPGQGAGGQTAAPAVHDVLAAALGSH
jgi:peptidoglycan glycosyltransferase